MNHGKRNQTTREVRHGEWVSTVICRCGRKFTGEGPNRGTAKIIAESKLEVHVSQSG